MKVRALHQFHPTIAFADAVGNDCFAQQDLLWRRGVASRLYAADAKPEVKAFVRPWHDLMSESRAGALVEIHVSMGNESLDEIARVPMGKVVRYHNITPAKFFAGVSEHNRHYSELGRVQLGRLAAVAELGIADSEYNRRELAEAGYAKTAVVPILFDLSAFDRAADPTVARALAAGGTVVLAVGQILPQKAVHEVVAAFASYRRTDPSAHLYLVGPTGMSGAYLDVVKREIATRGLEGAVTLTGRVSAAELVAYYQGASVLVTLSEHEGFCIPLVEAMRAGLPIVARGAGAIPETLGGAGVLLEDAGGGGDAAAAAIERVVRDRALRDDLLAKGRARLEDFTPERVAMRLTHALSTIGWDLPGARRYKIAVVSSDQRCGIHDYSQAVSSGLSRAGHEVDFVGVTHLDARDLARKIAAIPSGTDVVLVEHEAGIFSDLPFARALTSMWLRRLKVVLSLHELEPEKFHHYRRISAALHYRRTYRWPLELLRAPYVALRIALWFIAYRAVLALYGALPRRLIVHSDRAEYWLDLLTSDRAKIDQMPLVLMPLEDAAPPADDDEKRRLRQELGLPEDAFIFCSPGFFFRRKRFIEVIAAAPADSVVVLSGTEAQWEKGYLDEVRAYVEQHGLRNVLINTDFGTMGKYVSASDCVVLYYKDIFQSAVATQAIWAGKPCIFSALGAFDLYAGAGLYAADDRELRDAMERIRDREVYAALVGQVARLRVLLSPERNASRYLIGIE